MDFLPPDIDQYVGAHTSPEGPLLSKITRETQLKVLMPRMLSGHFQGRTLSMLSKMMQPKRILEIGTYTAYATLCLAEGLTADGCLHTIDINEELEHMVKDFVQQSSYASQIQYHVGNALDIIPALDEVFDLVFIDADKVNYAQYYEMVLPKMRIGGCIIADNVLWSGKVTSTPKPNDKQTNALIAFNKMVQEDPRVENLLLPIRDGLMVAMVI